MILVYLILVVILLTLAWVGGYKSRSKKLPQETVTAPVMPLHGAKLCLECESIFNERGVCPKCGANFNWPLESWLGIMNASTRPIQTTEGWAITGQ